jgi:hypothetical protein
MLGTFYNFGFPFRGLGGKLFLRLGNMSQMMLAMPGVGSQCFFQRVCCAGFRVYKGAPPTRHRQNFQTGLPCA